MALNVGHPLDELVISAACLDCSTGKAVCVPAPFKGRLIEVSTMLGSVLSTADATATATIAGTAVTGGAFVITQSSSAIGDWDGASVSGVIGNGTAANATITGANTCVEGDLVKLAITGSGTAGGVLNAYFRFRRN